MLTDLIRDLKDQDARSDAALLPNREQFRELSNMFRAASIGGGAHLSSNQCQMLMRTFATLAVSTVTVDDPPSS